MKVEVVAASKMNARYESRLRESFSFHHLEELRPEDFAKVRGVTVRAIYPANREFLARFPALEIVSVFGVGYDRVDVKAARERGIVVAHTPNVLTDDVADLGMALILSVSRRIPAAERHLLEGKWKSSRFPDARKVAGSRLGIVGLGRIGSAIARRAEGFDIEICYTDLEAKPGVSYRFYPSAVELAAEVDFLVASAYGGPTTQGMINEKVLTALGPKGYFINIARGSLVDEPALVRALQTGAIAGAGLDVFADEPNVPAELLSLSNVVLTPHIASSTEQTQTAMGDLAFANLEAYFSGRPVPTPIPSE